MRGLKIGDQVLSPDVEALLRAVQAKMQYVGYEYVARRPSFTTRGRAIKYDTPDPYDKESFEYFRLAVCVGHESLVADPTTEVLACLNNQEVTLYRARLTDEQYSLGLKTANAVDWATHADVKESIARRKWEKTFKARTSAPLEYSKMVLALPSGTVFKADPTSSRPLLIGEGCRTRVLAYSGGDFVVKIIRDDKPYLVQRMHLEVALGVVAHLLFPKFAVDTLKVFERQSEAGDHTVVVVMERFYMSLADIMVRWDHVFDGVSQYAMAVWFGKVFLQVAECLAAFQTPPHLFVHGDTAARNWLVDVTEENWATAEPRVKICDFGASAVYFDAKGPNPVMLATTQGPKLAADDIKPSSDTVLFAVSVVTLTSFVQDNGCKLPVCVLEALNGMFQTMDMDVLELAKAYWKADVENDGRAVVGMNHAFLAGSIPWASPGSLRAIAEFLVDPTNEAEVCN